MLTSPSRKVHPIHPAQILESAEFLQQIDQASSSLRNKPFRAKSVDFSAPSQRFRNASMASFLSQGSTGAARDNGVEVLINYLTANIENIIKDRDYLHKFEDLTADTLTEDHDAELHRIIKSHGWSGSRYRNSETTALEAQSLLQALSNLYLRNKMTTYTAHISNLFGLGDEKGADQILSFVPDLLLTCLKDQGPLSSENSETRALTFTGACMLADMSGFSKFSASMCSKGVVGLDELRETTNGFLGHIVKMVYEHRGDVIAFAGDALICVFLEDETPSADEAKHIVKRPDDNCCYRALKCAMKLAEHQTVNRAGQQQLSSHIGVSYGEMKLALLGGLHDQWVYLLNGACVSELASCITDAGPKEVAVTTECYNEALNAFIAYQKIFSSSTTPLTPIMRKTHAQKLTLEEGNVTSTESEQPSLPGQAAGGGGGGGEGHVLTPIAVRECESGNCIIERVDSLPTSGEITRASSSRKMSIMVRRSNSRHIHLGNESETQQSLIEFAAMFVPRPVLSAVYSESLEHIGELRQVTTMFLSVDSYSPEKHRDPCSLQPFFRMAQKVLFDSGGFLRQFLVDDKGCVFIAMWGMPSFTYANNCSRALYCAVDISVQAKNLEHACSIGITTGNVFCGNVGAPERRDYAGIGNEVNLAARLMSKAHGRVLLDQATYSNLNEPTKQLLIAAEAMNLKGMSEPITPFQYNSDTIPRVAALDENPGYTTILRKQVKAVLSAQIDKIVNSTTRFLPGQSKKVHFTLILGLPGTGKSTAAEYFRHGLRKHNIPCILMQARPGHEGMPYGLMRELFLELVGEDNFFTEAQQRQQITYLVEQAFQDEEESEKLRARLSLEFVLGVEWSDCFRMETTGGNDDSQLVHHDDDELRRSGSGDSSPVDVNTSRDAAGNLIINPNSPNTGSNRSSALKLTSPRNDLLKSAVLSNSNNLTNNSNAAVTRGGHESPEAEGMFMDFTQFLNRGEDRTFYRVLCVLLNNSHSAIVIEDAHFCDELSWNELHLLLLESELNLSVLITMRSNSTTKPAMSPSVSELHSSFRISPGPGGHSPSTPGHHGGNDRLTGKRHSVLIAASDSSSAYGGVGGSNNGISSHNMANQLDVEGSSRYGLKFQSSAAYLSVMGHENSTVVEMSSLVEEEVQDILKHTLKVDTIPNDLVRLVLDVSSGNAYWCKAIANFIKERGVKELEKEAKSGDSRQTLKQLILLRMEKLTVDQQLLLKTASIIGDEFSDKMLQACAPEKIKNNITEIMDSLSEHGFVQCIQESPNMIFGFDNALIMETVAALTPPRDAAHVHVAAAEFIEREYAKNLRPFYVILGNHYDASKERRHLAFKYKTKAADQAISRGAFSDGLHFATSATDLAESKPEITMLLRVINLATTEISSTGPGALGRKNSVLGAASPSVTRKAMVLGPRQQMAEKYYILKSKLEEKLKKLSKDFLKTEEASPGNKNRLIISKQPSATKLTWQASYVDSKLAKDDDDDDDDEEEIAQVHTKSKSMCTIT